MLKRRQMTDTRFNYGEGDEVSETICLQYYLEDETRMQRQFASKMKDVFTEKSHVHQKYEMLQVDMELCQASVDHFKSDRDYYKAKYLEESNGNSVSHLHKKTYHIEPELKCLCQNSNRLKEISRNSKKIYEGNERDKAYTEKKGCFSDPTYDLHLLENNMRVKETIIMSQAQKIRRLEKEIEDRNLSLKASKVISRNHSMEDIDVRRLRKESKKKGDGSAELNSQLQHALAKEKEAKEDLGKIKTKITQQNTIIQELKQKAKYNEKNIQDLENARKENRSQEQNIRHLYSEIDCKNRESKNLENKLRKQEIAVNVDNKQREDHITELKDQIQQALKKLKETEIELDKERKQNNMEECTKVELGRTYEHKIVS